MIAPAKSEFLPFRLHRFCRVTWASQAAREVWEPRFEQIRRALRATADLAIAAGGAYALRLERVYYHEVEPLRKQVGPLTLRVLRVDRPASELSRYYAEPFTSDEKRAFVLVGRGEAVQSAGEALAQNDFDAFHRSFGLHHCCIQALSGIIESGFTDSTWPIMSSSEKSASSGIEDRGSAATNQLLRRLGLTVLAHAPCRIDCPHSLMIADKRIAVAAGNGYTSEMAWLRECLAWPCSWSALHGIAEVKTPLFKMIYDTDATAAKLTVRKPGPAMPKESPAGIGFPFNSRSRSPLRS